MNVARRQAIPPTLSVRSFKRLAGCRLAGHESSNAEFEGVPSFQFQVSSTPQRGARRQPGVKRSGTLGHPTPRHLAPTGRTVITHILFRVPFQGTEFVVWRGPRGFTPGFHLLPLRGTSAVRRSRSSGWPRLRTPNQRPLPGNWLLETRDFVHRLLTSATTLVATSNLKLKSSDPSSNSPPLPPGEGTRPSEGLKAACPHAAGSRLQT